MVGWAADVTAALAGVMAFAHQPGGAFRRTLFETSVLVKATMMVFEKIQINLPEVPSGKEIGDIPHYLKKMSSTLVAPLSQISDHCPVCSHRLDVSGICL